MTEMMNEKFVLYPVSQPQMVKHITTSEKKQYPPAYQVSLKLWIRYCNVLLLY